MSHEFIKYAFIAGELSNRFIGRSDLQKFDLGLAIARNFFVDYRGGASTRPGTIFIDYIMEDDKPVKYGEFSFNPEITNTYVLLFGHEYLRFIQDGAYVLEDGETVSDITRGNPGRATVTGHGFSDGDWVKLSGVVGMAQLNGRTFQVANSTTNEFDLHDSFGNPVDTTGLNAYVSGGEAARIYTVTTPYDSADLVDLRIKQNRDTLRLTHRDYETRNLTRTGHTNWSISIETIGNDGDIPTGLAATKSDSGAAGVLFAVTAVVNGQESQPSQKLIVDTVVEYTTTAGSVKLTWNAVADADYYNVYRSIVLADDGNLSLAQELGFLGRAYGPVFIDNNIIPDFTATPPLYRNPFAHQSITAIAVTNGGSSYAKDDTVTISDANGTGFIGFPIVEDGEVLAVVIENGGEGFTGPTVVFNTSTGSGAAATATVGPASGNYPGLSERFQQRQLYAASENDPLGIWGSRPGALSNFDESRILLPSDAYQFEIESEKLTPIRHMVPNRGGLLVMAQTGIWLLHGGQETAVTATNAASEPHAFTGVSKVPPVTIDSDVLYTEGKGVTVRMLSYNEFSKVYGGIDVSILSNHLFGPNKHIERWAFAQDPYRLVWAQREDGAMLSFTTVKEQDVFAWTHNHTRGQFKDVITVQEGRSDTTYLVVKRFVNGRWSQFLEKFAPRELTHIEDAWCVDCGLGLANTYPAGTLTPSASTGTGVMFEADASVFSGNDIGKIIYAGGGKARVVGFSTTFRVVCDIIRDLTEVVEEDPNGMPLPVTSGNWSIDEPVQEASGLYHLEGEQVKGLVDGNVTGPFTVVDGRINWGFDATKACFGLGFRARLKTLPLTHGTVTIEGRRKRVVGVAVRLTQTRGIRIGQSFDKMYPMKERTVEKFGEPTGFIEGIPYVLVAPEWSEDGSVCFEIDDPVPATILGLVVDADVGDDTE